MSFRSIASHSCGYRWNVCACDIGRGITKLLIMCLGHMAICDSLCVRETSKPQTKKKKSFVRLLPLNLKEEQSISHFNWKATLLSTIAASIISNFVRNCCGCLLLASEIPFNSHTRRPALLYSSSTIRYSRRESVFDPMTLNSCDDATAKSR